MDRAGVLDGLLESVLQEEALVDPEAAPLREPLDHADNSVLPAVSWVEGHEDQFIATVGLDRDASTWLPLGNAQRLKFL